MNIQPLLQSEALHSASSRDSYSEYSDRGRQKYYLLYKKIRENQ